MLGIYALCLSVYASAWSEIGHQYISGKVYAALAKSDRRLLDQMAKAFPGDVHFFTELSSWVDRQRGLSLSQVFQSQGEAVPAIFAGVAALNTDAWHYQNHYIYAGEGLAERCDLKATGQLHKLLPLLHRGLISGGYTPTQQTILLAYWLHLMEDLHQPLHTVSYVDQRCRSDYGGNGTCLTESDTTHKCTLNLHQLWDRGAGFFQSSMARQLTISQTDPMQGKSFGHVVDTFAEKYPKWLVESQSYGRLAYEQYFGNANVTAASRSDYEKFVSQVAELQSRRAVERILRFLPLYIGKSHVVSD